MSAQSSSSEHPAIGVGHYENFPVASWLCPPSLRAPIQALYRFARTADDIADEGPDEAPGRLDALARYTQALRDAVNSTPTATHPWRGVFEGLHPFLADGRIPLQPLLDLLDAFQQDVRKTAEGSGYRDRDELLHYCSRSANPVGRVVLHLCGVHDAPSLVQSDAICSALQLINFWQDVSQDIPRRRFYLPEADLMRHGMPPKEPESWSRAASRTRLLAECCEWSRALMLAGAPLVHRVPGRMGWELRLVVQGGLRIIDRLAAVNFDAFHHRPKLKALDMLPMLCRAALMRPPSATIHAR